MGQQTLAIAYSLGGGLADQVLGQLHMAVLEAVVQGGVPGLVLGVDVCCMAQQELGDAWL